MRNLIPISVLLMFFSSAVLAEEASKPAELNLNLHKDMIEATPDHTIHTATNHHSVKTAHHKTKHERAIEKGFDHAPSNADDANENHQGNVFTKSY